MTDEQAVLRAVLDDPDCDAPRLVYADWLDEHAERVSCPTCSGDGRVWDNRSEVHDPCPTCRGSLSASDGRTERAEFIRVQCKLAEMTEAQRQSPAGLSLRRRQYVVIKAFRPSLLPAFPRLVEDNVTQKGM